MERQQKTKQAMARKLKTSRSQLDRLLDSENTAVSLDTLAREAVCSENVRFSKFGINGLSNGLPYELLIRSGPNCAKKTHVAGN